MNVIDTLDEPEVAAKSRLLNLPWEAAADASWPDGQEEERWIAHERINTRGFGVDWSTMRDEHEATQERQSKLTKQLERLTRWERLLWDNGRGFKKWLATQGHDAVGSHVGRAAEWLVKESPSNQVREACRVVLAHRQLEAEMMGWWLAERWPGDDRLRHVFLYAGARTGRWTTPATAFHSARRGGRVRQLVQAGGGCSLWVADYHAMELRLVMQLAGEPFVGDPYKLLADEAGIGRDQAKVVMLAGMYGAGGKLLNGMVSMAGGGREEVTKRSGDVHAALHATFPGWKRSWDALERAAHQEGEHEVLGGQVRVSRRGDSLSVTLPTGRRTSYAPCRSVDGRLHYVDRARDAWVDVSRGATLFNHVVQGWGRDLLADAMVRLDRVPGAQVVGHHHDSVLVEVAGDLAGTPAMAARLEKEFLPATGVAMKCESYWSPTWGPAGSSFARP